jgi:hypothetical protein
MSAESRRDGKGYETLDAQAGPTYRAGVYILGAMFLVAAALVPMYRFLVRSERTTQPRASSVVRQDPAAAQPAFPRLVTSEPKALAEFRAKEDELLEGWGWVEKDRGIARMPVAEAIALVGARGVLPALSSPAPAAESAAAAPAAPAGAGR